MAVEQARTGRVISIPLCRKEQSLNDSHEEYVGVQLGVLSCRRDEAKWLLKALATFYTTYLAMS